MSGSWHARGRRRLLDRTGSTRFLAAATATDVQVLADLVLSTEPGPALVARSTAGDVLWSTPTDADVSAAVVPDARTLVVVGAKHVRGLDLATGEVAWDRPATGASRFSASPRGLLLQVADTGSCPVTG